MRNTLKFCILAAGVSATSLAYGQEPAPPSPTATPPPLPPGPLIQKAAPTNAEWSITYKYVSGGGAGALSSPSPGAKPVSNGQAGGEGEAREAANPMNKVVVITKTGDERREVTTTATNVKTVAYYSHGLRVVYEPRSKEPSLEATGQGNDYPGFGWISEKNYVGISKAQGRDCIIFQGKAKATEMAMWQGLEAPKEPYPASAVIDLESRLPFTVKIGEEIRTYRYGNPPTDPIVLPPEAQALINARIKRVQQSNVAPPPP